MRLTLALAALLAACAGWGLWQRHMMQEALARATAAEAQVAGYAEAAQVLADERARLARLAEDAAAQDRALQDMEGADAPRSDYLGAASGRLWP